MESTRFPGKPLANIAGRSLIERVYRIARTAAETSSVFVATDSERVSQHVASFGGSVVQVKGHFANGTERAFGALGSIDLDDDEVVIVQVDMPLVVPSVIQSSLKMWRRHRDRFDVATTLLPLSGAPLRTFLQSKKSGRREGVCVTTGNDSRILYMSRSVIPHDVRASTILRHVGVYMYSRSALSRYSTAPKGRYETGESIELLRLIEAGERVLGISGDWGGRSHWPVDTAEDVKVVEEIIKREGELVEL